MKSGLSILIASSGRPSLTQTVASVSSQLRPGDELIVDVNQDAPWGHQARNRMMKQATGGAFAFMDDDDCYAVGALDRMRAAAEAESHRVHIFKMRYKDGRVLWEDREVRQGNISTQMVVVPNMPGALGRWGDRYEGDFDFIYSTCESMGEPVWHDEVVAFIRP